MNMQSIAKMTAAASSLGWAKDEFKERFTSPDETRKAPHEWVKKEVTTATETGEIQCVNYQDQHGDWLVVFNE